MIYIVFDLEATCWNYRTVFQPEIIEIGAVCVHEEKGILGEFAHFVRPTICAELSSFCMELTSITQENIDQAESFPVVATTFRNWIMSFEEEYAFASWGKYDVRQLVQDCRLNQIPYDWIRKHVNLKQQYKKFRKLRQPAGLKNAIIMEGMEFMGTHHRGIDDARNAARILMHYAGSWQVNTYNP